MKHIAEISLLRALAITQVVGYHYFPQFFPGGFIGVDIFFVISGFLIAKVLTSSDLTVADSWFRFLKNRFFRIYPALTSVAILSIFFSYFLILPDEYENLAQSVIASIFAANNILLNLTSGYWDIASSFKPLLHTWSLGVEEQSYLILLFVFALVHRLLERKALLTLLLISSFVMLLYFNISGAKNAGFYLVLSRFWEVAAGALVFLLKKNAIDCGINFRRQLLYSSSLVILVTLTFVSYGELRNPAYYALTPVVLTCLILYLPFKHNGRELKCFKPLIGVGLISYSLYLLHWPALVLLESSSKNLLTLTEKVVLLLFVLIASFLSYRYVEQPFRERTVGVMRYTFLFASLFLIVVFSAFVLVNKGLPDRYSDTKDFSQYIDISYNSKLDKPTPAHGVLNELLHDKKIIIFGDSFANDFYNILGEGLVNNMNEVVLLSQPFRCFGEYAETVLTDTSFKGRTVFLASSVIPWECILENISYFVSLDARVYVVSPKNFGDNLNWLMLVDESKRKQLSNDINSDFLNYYEKYKKIIPAQHQFDYFSGAIINGSVQITDEFGFPLSQDRSHLTRYGAKYFSEYIRRNSDLYSLVRVDRK